MSYTSINLCATDVDVINRIAACAAQVGQEMPEQKAYEWKWRIASQTDIEAAYEAAVVAENPAPGIDPDVITDAMILEAVTYILNPMYVGPEDMSSPSGPIPELPPL